MSDARYRRKEFERFYTEAYGRHILTAMLVGIGALLATALLDALFQPDQARDIWQARAFMLAPMGLLTLLSSLRGFARAQQFIIVAFTLIGCAAVLEFARRSIPPYHHYYNNAVVLIVMFCFVLTRILFRWGLVCAALLFLICNIYWVALAPDSTDLLIIKNFVLLVTCLFSLMAAWTLEIATRDNFVNQQTLREERDELLELQQEQARLTWLNRNLGDYQVRISGDRNVDELFAITMRFLSANEKVGFGAALYMIGDRLLRKADYALPAQRRSDQITFIDIGEGLTGQAAINPDLLVVNQVPQDYARVVSGIGDMLPRQLVFCPVRYQQECKGVIELALTQPGTDIELDLLREIGTRLGHALVVAEARHPEPVDGSMARVQQS